MGINPEYTINKYAFICLFSWMANNLDLKPLDMIIFAVIYGFRKSEGGVFYWNPRYLQSWTHMSQRSIYYSLNNLIEKGYIEKILTFDENGKNVSAFRISESKLKELNPDYPFEVFANFAKSRANLAKDRKEQFANLAKYPINLAKSQKEPLTNLAKSRANLAKDQEYPFANIAKPLTNLSKSSAKFATNNNTNNNSKSNILPPIAPQNEDCIEDPFFDTSLFDTQVQEEPPIDDTPPETEYFDPEYGCKQEYHYDDIGSTNDPYWYERAVRDNADMIAKYNLPVAPRECMEETDPPEVWQSVVFSSADDVFQSEHDEINTETPPKCVPDSTPILSRFERGSEDGNIKKTLPKVKTPLKSDSEALRKVRKRNTRLKEKMLEDFNRFWSAYPKKVSVAKAEKEWDKINPDEETVEKILADIEYKKKNYTKWTKNSGAYIEHPATYLNSQNWRDEITPVTQHLAIVYNEKEDYEDEATALAEMERIKIESERRREAWLRKNGFPEGTKYEDVIKDPKSGKYILKTEEHNNI